MVQSIGSGLPSLSVSSVNIHSCLESLKQKLYTLLKRIFEAPVGYFLKISIFRHAAMRDSFSQWVTLPFVLAVENLWKRSQGIALHQSFDAARLEKSANFLSEFAEVQTLQTSDGKTL